VLKMHKMGWFGGHRIRLPISL